MKRCPKCKQEKEFGEFAKHSKRADGLQSICRVCKSEAYRQYYAKDAERYKENTRRRKESLRDYVRKLKESSPCTDCGVSYPYYVMDFDHLPEHIKLNQVGFFTERSKSKLLDEIAKCELVCSNCHRERTWQRSLP